jgi:hypothetical protein
LPLKKPKKPTQKQEIPVAKISRPVIYVLLAAVGVGAWFFTEPEAGAKKKAARTATASARTAREADSNLTPEDLKTRFPRYSGAARDAFRPEISTARPKLVAPRPAPPLMPVVLPAPPKKSTASVALDAWTLTGISVVDGEKTALIENKATSDMAFVRAGTSWKGLRVLAIETGALVFALPDGSPKRLTFPVPPEEKVAASKPAAPDETSVPPPAFTPRRTSVAGSPGTATETGAQP